MGALVTYRYLEYIFYPSGTGVPAKPKNLVAPYTFHEEAVYRGKHMVEVLRYARSQMSDLAAQNPVTGVKESEILKIFS